MNRPAQGLALGTPLTTGYDCHPGIILHQKTCGPPQQGAVRCPLSWSLQAGGLQHPATQGHKCCSGLPGQEAWGTMGQWAGPRDRAGGPAGRSSGGGSGGRAVRTSKSCEAKHSGYCCLKTGASARDGVEGGFWQRGMRHPGKGSLEKEGAADERKTPPTGQQ